MAFEVTGLDISKNRNRNRAKRKRKPRLQDGISVDFLNESFIELHSATANLILCGEWAASTMLKSKTNRAFIAGIHRVLKPGCCLQC
jgi:hypothetical protein